jgi:hypothetical protein
MSNEMMSLGLHIRSIQHPLTKMLISLLDQVMAWASKGKVPHAIDSTSNFVEVMGRDASNAVSEHELRLLYSMAFIRFVNGLIDPAQKGAYAQSMNGIAESIGLPAWFVDLRHAGTHDQLPAISLLRNGCHQVGDSF